jgi:hypothetical protein
VPPTIIVVEERLVESDLCPVTVRGSQGDVAPLLFASPEYTALKLNVPAERGVKDAELGTTPLVTVTVETTVAVPAQVPPLNSL